MAVEARDLRWVSMKAVVAGPSGRQVRVDAKVPDPDQRPSANAGVTVLVTIALLALGLFVPPVLLLGIPILVARSALRVVQMSRYDRVGLGPFACPECGGENPQGERRGELPLDFSCERCCAALSAGQVPRVYAADRAG